MFDDLSSSEAERLRKRFDAWREAMEGLKARVPREDAEEPLFASELELEA